MLIKTRERVGELLRVHVFPNAFRQGSSLSHPPSHSPVLRVVPVIRSRPLEIMPATIPTTSTSAKHQLKPFDPVKVASDVHALAGSDAPIAPLVNEALQVIEQALDSHGCVEVNLLGSSSVRYNVSVYVTDRSTFLSASMAAKTVRPLP